MSCTNPQCAFVPLKGGSPIFCRLSDQPKGTFFHPTYGYCRVVYLPCGGCLSCRRERRQELTLLQCCEASLNDDNWFITLTYDDKYFYSRNSIPPRSLIRDHLSDFCESMRHYCRYNGGTFRFFACGEYGDRYGRPHYHLSVFGLSPSLLDFPLVDDVREYQRRALTNGRLLKIKPGTIDSEGREYWQSPVISAKWPYGSHKIFRASRETFQYVAGYVTKKLTGKLGRDFEASGRIREFQAQSRPSIGRPWFDRFCSSLSNPTESGELINDCVAISGIEWKCPRIFSKWLASYDHFDGKKIVDRLSALRQLGYTELEPDRDDLKRISDFERYRAAQAKQNNKHKEV